MEKVVLQVQAEVGLHARPAAILVQQAGRFHSQIALRNLTAHSQWVNAKSILNVLTLGVEKDHEIELEVNGPDENEAVAALSSLVRFNFGGVQPIP